LIPALQYGSRFSGSWAGLGKLEGVATIELDAYRAGSRNMFS